MIVTREDVRKKIVTALKAVMDTDFPAVRVQWPGSAPVDVSTDKSAYVNLKLIYMDGDDVGIGPDAPTRMMGTIQLECCYKEGDGQGLITVNNLLDAATRLFTSNDMMYPVRTYSTRQVSPPNGPREGWQEEGLVTPFWFDTSKR